MTKQQEYYLKLFIKIKPQTLYDVYKDPSARKRRIWEDIKAACKMYCGFRLTVLTYNSHFFTCAFAYDRNDETIIAVFTPKGLIKIPLARRFFDCLPFADIPE